MLPAVGRPVILRFLARKPKWEMSDAVMRRTPWIFSMVLAEGDGLPDQNGWFIMKGMLLGTIVPRPSSCIPLDSASKRRV